jgi:M6 family metalloprotease-like protein
MRRGLRQLYLLPLLGYHGSGKTSEEKMSGKNGKPGWRRLVLGALLAVSSIGLPAAYLTSVPVTVNQPDGQLLNLFASGDEYYNWLHDAQGFTIIQDPANGYFVYALKVGGRLRPSTLLPGAGVDPGALGFACGVLDDLDRRLNPDDIFPAGDEIVNVPHSGTLNNLAVFIRFSGESEFGDNISSYNALFNTATSGANSMRNYFYEASYGALTIPTTFYPTPGTKVVSFQDSHARNYFQPYNAVTNPAGYSTTDGGLERLAREHALLKSAVDAVSSQVPVGLIVDGDGDGRVDNVCFIVRGAPDAWSNLLWPHRWSLYSQTAYISGKRVYDYNFQLQTTTLSWGVGVLSHEMFHSLGSPDLYHYTSNGITPVGPWDLMETTSNPPEHMLMYMKWKYGLWLASIPQITVAGVYTLNPTTAAANNCYRIASPNSATQYFVVEYRRRVGTFEGVIPNEGLIVYRINTAVSNGNRNGPPDEVYVYRPNGTLTVNGTVSDANFSSNSGRTAINDGSNPSSFLADGTAGGLDISNVTAVGATISFTVGVGGGYVIGGTVTAGGSPLPGVTLNGLPGNPVSNGSGVYSAVVPSGWSGTVTPTLAGYVFTPAQTAYSNVTGNRTTDYTAAALPPLLLCAPNGGEVWQQGTVHQVTWTSYGVANVKIEYSTNNGGAWTTAVASTPAAGGSYAWTVPAAPSANCLVRVSDAANAATLDVSNAVFTISATAPALYNAPAARLFLPEATWAKASGSGDWVSELQLVDCTGGSTVQVYYNTGTSRRGPFTLWSNNGGAAGSSVMFSNVIQTIDSLDGAVFTYYGTGGALELATQDNSHKIQAAVRSYNGNFSRTFPGLADVETNTAAVGRSLIIPNLSNDASYRPSVVLFNPTADAVTVEGRIVGSDGGQVGSTINRTLAGYEQNTIVTEVRSNTYSNADFRVTVTGGSGRVICSGQSANNASNDPAAHLAVQTTAGYANSMGNRLVLPETTWALASGGGDWVSEVHVTDLSGGAVVTAWYNTGTSRRGPFTLWTNGGGAGRSTTFANILQTLDGLDGSAATYYGTGGSLELITQDGSHLIQAAVRTFNGNFSRTFPGLLDREETTAALGRVLLIPNICNNSLYRPSVVLFNPSADTVTVEVKIIGSAGTQLGSTITRVLAGYQQNTIVDEVRAFTYDNAKVRVEVTAGSGRVIVSGQSANNASNDPAAHVAVQGQ